MPVSSSSRRQSVAAEYDVLASLTALIQVSEGFIRWKVEAAGCRPLRPSHERLLAAIGNDAPTVGELGVQLGVTKQAVSEALEALGRLGLVSRRATDDDARYRRAVLTTEGSTTLQAHQKARRDVVSALRQRYGVGGYTELVDLLDDAAQTLTRRLK